MNKIISPILGIIQGVLLLTIPESVPIIAWFIIGFSLLSIILLAILGAIEFNE